MKTLVIGGHGYIGTSLQKILPDAVILDKTTGTDVRDIVEIGDGYDAVVYLAGLRLRESEQNPDEAMEVNYKSAVRLANTTNAHFIFASSCSSYGYVDSLHYAVETDPLSPTSVYAKSKVAAEKELNGTILRFATAYGVNEKTRQDLILHEFIEAGKKGEITLYGPGFYRPICHVDDIARAIKIAVEKQPGGVWNVGDTHQNYTKYQLAEMVQKETGCKIVCKSGAQDPRNYQVSFEKVKQLGFEAKHKPEETVRVLASS